MFTRIFSGELSSSVSNKAFDLPKLFVYKDGMAINSAISILGSPAGLASSLGVTPQVVNNWVARGRVPAERCPDIERVTDGVVTCEALRPDVDWSYLRQTCKDAA
jgi:DNA-binding transcriptional regulator YdaS (Cro superfamily)